MAEKKTTDIDRKIEALASLKNHWGWKTFEEVILQIQGVYQAELFKKKFASLEPFEMKVKYNRVIGALEALNRLVELTVWLEKRKPEYWHEVSQKIMEEFLNVRK